MIEYSSILVTGGTGSFGKQFIKTVLARYPGVKRLVVYSRDELKQFEMQQDLSPEKYPQLRYFIGDVRDQQRLRRAMDGIDIVIHAAALKQVPAAEYNPFEAVKTNIIGAQNVIECSIDMDVKKVVALSTDKAAAPTNLYGATKLTSDKLFVSANHYAGKKDLKFSVVRYGNVLGSRGSVIPFFMKMKKSGVLPITDERMTRFSITLNEGVDMVLMAVERMWGGELFVPRIPSYRILDVARAICPECKTENVGIRPGEKLHETMITEHDALTTVECEGYFVILPTTEIWDTEKFMSTFGCRRCPDEFEYSSDRNDEWLSVEDLRALIQENLISEP